MLGKLIAYELVKKWKSSKFLLLGYIMVQAVILLVIRIFIWNEGLSKGFYLVGNSTTQTNIASAPAGSVSASFVILTVLFIILALFIGAYPFIESIYRYERDLSGKQAYLELMIPAVGWMKVLAKLIATMVSLVICGTLSLISMFLFFMVNSNFRYLMDLVKQFLDLMARRGLDVAMMILFMLFSIASAYMIIFFCISVAKAFTHKNTIAVPIGIFVFIILTGCLGLISAHLNRFPIVTFRVGEIAFMLSSALLDIAVLLATLAGTSWLIEKKIEH